MSKCDNCGRDDGHWLGCANAPAPKPLPVNPDQLSTGNPDECFHEGCINPKRPAGKGPKPKFCEEHSDPKNRK
jgi:hypothetical protein